MKRKYKICSTITLICTLFSGSVAYGKTTAPAVPNYEVKIYMDPSIVLDSNNELNEDVLNSFEVTNSPLKMSVEYLDSMNLDLNNNGWDVRFRKKENDENFELTYKKRYAIQNGDIDGALNKAASEGFDKNEEDYEAQVDWGYGKETLSFSNDKDANISGYEGIDLPSSKEVIKAAVNKIPGKLTNIGGKDILKNAYIYGPVDSKRYTGVFNGEKLYIEVWNIKNSLGNGYEKVVEASFKTDSRSEAEEGHDELIDSLKENGWLLPKDELKTQMILDRY